MIKSIAHDQPQKHFKYLWLDFRLPIFDYGSKHMDENLFKRRTKQLALRVIKAVEGLPKNRTADVIGRQLIRSGTSIGANYRAACRGKSTADVIAKLRIVEEEADESAYWMELLIESGLLPESRLSDLLQETNEILAMTVASIRTLQKRNGSSPFNRQSKIENLK
jgi:four helix bundle protein